MLKYIDFRCFIFIVINVFKELESEMQISKKKNYYLIPIEKTVQTYFIADFIMLLLM